MKISWHRALVIELGILAFALTFQIFVNFKKNDKFEIDLASAVFILSYLFPHLVLMFNETIHITTDVIRHFKLNRVNLWKILTIELSILLCATFTPIVFYFTRVNYGIQAFILDCLISCIWLHLLLLLLCIQVIVLNKYYGK